MDTCQSCKFWFLAQVCRRYPSIVPKTSSDWCGEFQAVKQEIPAESIPEPALQGPTHFIDDEGIPHSFPTESKHRGWPKGKPRK